MRHPRVVVRAALIAVLTAVAVPALAISRPPSFESVMDPSAFSAVGIDGSTGRSTTTLTLDTANRSDAALDPDAILGDPAPLPDASLPPRPATAQPAPAPVIVELNPWRYDRNVSFYGPGFYGKRTACGHAYTTTIMGVAHRTLPCGTMITFRNPANGTTITVPVIDRGPYVAWRQWDLSGAACTALGHCYTGAIYWKYAR